MTRHPAYELDECQHRECQPGGPPRPAPYLLGPEAARRWIADLAEQIPELVRLAAADRQMPGRWMEILGRNEWMRANAWTHAFGDTDQTRAEQDDMRRRAALLFAADSIGRHVKYRRNPARSTRYAGAEWVEPDVADVLDRMAEAVDVPAVWAMLPELRQAAADAMGEHVASALDPFTLVGVR